MVKSRLGFFSILKVNDVSVGIIADLVWIIWGDVWKLCDDVGKISIDVWNTLPVIFCRYGLWTVDDSLL